MRLHFAVLLVCVCLLPSVDALADPVRVRYKEGVIHGFFVLSTLDGTQIADGDLTQVVHADRITNHLVFRFKDGSLQDETTVSSQRDVFRLINYHLVQKGPTFQHPLEVSIVVSTGQVTVHFTDDKGKEQVKTERLKLPPDLANGLVPTLLRNIRADAPKIQLSMVVATPKPRLVKLAITANGEDPFTFGASSRKATHYVLKVDIGGVAGLVAPLLGKEPPDSHVWILGGEAPTFVKSEALSYMGGPLWRTELVSPVWPKATSPDSKDGSAAKH